MLCDVLLFNSLPLPYILEKIQNMANLLEYTTCVTAEDIRDSLTSDILLLNDTEILKMIIRAEARVDSYLWSIGSEYSCAECIACEDLPIKIKQAIVLDVEYLFANPVNNEPVEPKVISRTAKSCDEEITEEFCNTCTSDSNPCDELSCDITNLLNCFAVNALSFSLCADTLCSDDATCSENICLSDNTCKSRCLSHPL